MTDNPCDWFADFVNGTRANDKLLSEIRALAARRAINMSWLSLWRRVFLEALLPMIQARGDYQELLRTGYEVISDGPLAQHPTLGPYVTKGATLNFRLWVQNLYPMDSMASQEYLDELVAVARSMPLTAQHAMPGQPWYRMMLGALVPSPSVRFSNFTWYAPQVLEVATTLGVEPYRVKDHLTFEGASEEVRSRVDRFRQAEAAVKLGLPPDAFE